MAIINNMMKKLDTDISNLKEGLHPENLSYWYDKIIKETIDMAPPWLQDKIKVKQDPILTMKFNLDISKRAVRYFMIVVDNNLDDMPYSTKLYFLKVLEMTNHYVLTETLSMKDHLEIDIPEMQENQKCIL